MNSGRKALIDVFGVKQTPAKLLLLQSRLCVTLLVVLGLCASVCSAAAGRDTNTIGRVVTDGLLSTAKPLPSPQLGDAEKENPGLTQFQRVVRPILEKRCYVCHGDGMSKGGLAFDKLITNEQILHNPELWYKVLKNTRSHIMPPKGNSSPTQEEQSNLEQWIKTDGFGLDPNQPDPGRVTIRRLNRNEYHNVMRDLLGIDFPVAEALPMDDVGYGFDNIGDVLSISPLRMEKFIEAAMAAVEQAVPMDTLVIPKQVAMPEEFLSADGSETGDHISFYGHSKISRKYHAEIAGDFRIHIAGKVDGETNPDPQRARVHALSDGKEFFRADYSWSDNELYDDERVVHWEAGDHVVGFTIEPLLDLKPLPTKMDYRLQYVRVEGPLDRKYWEHPPGYHRFFTRESPPETKSGRRAYAREILSTFARKAFRQPVTKDTVERFVDLAEKSYSLPGVPFEKGVAQAMVAVLASPDFLFHFEGTEALGPGTSFGRIDEYALASRLSFMLWASIPDEELLQLAARRELRNKFQSEVQRMLADPKSQAFIENFPGQWLQTRGVQEVEINSAEVMAREKPPLAPEAATTNAPAAGGTNAPQAARARGRNRGPAVPAGTVLTPEIRQAMKQEAEAYFSYIVHGDRSVLELLDSNYTFVNDKLAALYGITNISGPEMRRVILPPGDLRGGVLTMGGVLTVTSNPARTSPVKRGKWILQNILGAPSAPPPPNVPPLEEAQSKLENHTPTQRELLAAHRNSPLCASCHARMDPLGLALENFNAFGRVRTQEMGQPIDPTGELATGEKFADIRDLKQALVEKHRVEFYRTLTEKLLTYTLGRGLEYYDVPAVDGIVDQLEMENGRFSALLFGVLDSTPFQASRPAKNAASAETHPASIMTKSAIKQRTTP